MTLAQRWKVLARRVPGYDLALRWLGGLARRRGELPPRFDWRFYLESYPDLPAVGIDSEAKAIWHWLRHGAAEGREAEPPSYPTRSTFLCPSVHSLYLRATGTLVCWDDAGSDEVLQAFDEEVHYSHDVYLGPVYNHVRFSLAAGRLPFEVCQRCLVLRCGVEHSSYHLDKRVIEIFQVEPSFRCTLDCPGCVPLATRRQAPPENLDPATFAKILDDLVDAGVTVRAFDFQGHGEPLLHPGLWRLVSMARRACPQSYLTVTTNAHGAVKEEIFHCGIDEIVCAIDGVDQATFAPYRVHGRFDLAWRFLRGVAEESRRRGAGIKVIWKYVLFAHNSAPEHLLAAQRLAAEAGIDELVFVFTRNGPPAHSVRRLAEVPRLPGGVKISFRHHEPSVEDLRKRLVEVRESLAAGDRERGAEIAGSVARNLARFFANRDALTRAHEALLRKLLEIARRLPAESHAAILASLRHLLDPARARAEGKPAVIYSPGLVVIPSASAPKQPVREPPRREDAAP